MRKILLSMIGSTILLGGLYGLYLSYIYDFASPLSWLANQLQQNAFEIFLTGFIIVVFEPIRAHIQSKDKKERDEASTTADFYNHLNELRRQMCTSDHVLALNSLHALLASEIPREELFANQELVGLNLPKVELMMYDFHGANLTQANLQSANLNRAIFSNAIMAKADLKHASLVGADLRNADLVGADLTEAILTGANLSGANLTGAKVDWYSNLQSLNDEEDESATTKHGDYYFLEKSAASLSGATLPNGLSYESWLYSRVKENVDRS